MFAASVVDPIRAADGRVGTFMSDPRSETSDRAPARTGDDTVRDLVEPEGVNAGSSAAERDRRPSSDIPVRTAAGEPEREAPPIEEAAGLPEQRPDVPGQQLGVPD